MHGMLPEPWRAPLCPDPGNAGASSLSDLFSSGRTTVPQSQYDSATRTGPGSRTHVCPGASEVDDLGTAVAVLLEAGALEAVEGVGDTLATTHDALILVVAEAALVADTHQRRRSHVGVAYGTFTVALVA